MKDRIMDHERIEEMVAAFALGSLERGDEAEHELLEHIPGCSSCRALFRDLREVAADLALAAPARPVPPSLEQRILARIRGEERPVVKPAVRSISMRTAAVAAAVALVLAGGLGAWAASLSGRIARAERRAALAAAALSVVNDPNASVYSLTGGRGSLLLASRPGGRAVLVGSGMPDPGEGKIYELWLLKDTKATAIDVFRPDDGAVVLPVDSDILAFDAVAVTIETGKVDRPTTQPVYTTRLDA
jgi:hypothetical protein